MLLPLTSHCFSLIAVETIGAVGAQSMVLLRDCSCMHGIGNRGTACKNHSLSATLCGSAFQSVLGTIIA